MSAAAAQRWRDAVVATFGHQLAELRATMVLASAQARRDTITALRGVAVQVGDRELDEAIGEALKEADKICARLAVSASRRWGRRR